jgi:hypothetical protein
MKALGARACEQAEHDAVVDRARLEPVEVHLGPLGTPGEALVRGHAFGAGEEALAHGGVGQIAEQQLAPLAQQREAAVDEVEHVAFGEHVLQHAVGDDGVDAAGQRRQLVAQRVGKATDHVVRRRFVRQQRQHLGAVDESRDPIVPEDPAHPVPTIVSVAGGVAQVSVLLVVIQELGQPTEAPLELDDTVPIRQVSRPAGHQRSFD